MKNRGMNQNRNGVRRVSDTDIAREFTGVSDTDVDQAVAERTGSDDKVEAAKAENAPPKVKTYTPEGRAWIESDPHGLRTEGLYGQRGRLAIRPEDLQLRAQFLGRSLTVADLEEIHSVDTTAPASATCTSCQKEVTSFVRTALIDKKGDLLRDQSGNVIYRGQFVVTGKPLAVFAAHTGDCLYKLRNARGKKKTLPNNRMVADLLASQSATQADSRLTGIRGSQTARQNENREFKERLGFTVADGARRTDDGIDRGSFAPKTPRGQTRKQRNRWVEEEEVAGA